MQNASALAIIPSDPQRFDMDIAAEMNCIMHCLPAATNLMFFTLGTPDIIEKRKITNDDTKREQLGKKRIYSLELLAVSPAGN